VSVSEVAQSVYWSTVINTFGAGSATLAGWADYRLRMGRYFYRTFNASDPAHSGDLLLAYNEFRAVQNLGVSTSAAQANQWISWLASNLNALGLPYDMWIKPDFANFQSDYLGYLPAVATEVGIVSNLISAGLNATAVNTQLGLMATHATDELNALTLDQTAAQRAVTDAQALLTGLNQQMTDLQQQITASDNVLQQAQYNFAAGLPLAWASDVINAVVTVAGPAAGVAGLGGRDVSGRLVRVDPGQCHGRGPHRSRQGHSARSR